MTLRSRCTVAERSPPSRRGWGGARARLRSAALFLLGSGPSFACGSLFGIDSPRIVSRGDGDAGEGGEGGAAGESTAGGVAGAASGRGGTHAGGSGGTSGAGVGRGGSAGDAGANAGGAGGDPGPDPGPTLGEACDDHGRFSCTTANPNITLACDLGTWILGGFCAHDQRCNARAECERVDISCAGGTHAICASDGNVIDCSVSPFRPPSRICPYGCQTGRCLPGTGDELIVHTDDDDQTGGSRWPSAIIPTCFLKSDTDAQLPAWIRSEVERTWGRYLNVEFTGWGECSSDSVEGVVIEFLENCELRLGGKPPNGFPGDGGQSRVGICSSYENSAGGLEFMTQNESLLRFVVRHQFGHVLGLSEWELPSTETVMVRALEKSNAARLELTRKDVSRFLTSNYGYKPSGTLVTTSGLCLTPFDETIRPTPCSHDGSGRFSLATGAVRSLLVDAQGCLTLSGGDGAAVGLAPCGTAPASSALRMARARWSTPDRCVAPDFPAPGSAIATRACAPVGDPAQAWFFEIVAEDQDKLSARIHFSATGDCLSVPGGTATVYDVPVLETCGQTLLARHVFYLWRNGQISFDDLSLEGTSCLNWDSPDSALYFASCNFDSYWVFGALETPNGLALAIDPSDQNAELRADRLGSNALPNDEQIFGFAF